MHHIKKLVLVLYLSVLASPLMAQQASTAVEGFSFIAPLRITAGTDTNFLVDRSLPVEKLFILSLPPSVHLGAADVRPKRLDDQVLTITLPQIAFQNDSRRHELTFTYVPEVELYRKNHDQNAWNHEATASFVYSLSRRLHVSIADTYRTSKDPARTLQNVFLLLPRSRFQDNALRGAVDFQSSAVMTFRVRYDDTRSTFGQTDPFQTRILDNRARGLSFVATRMLKPNHRVRGTYSFYKIAPINRARPNDDAVDVRRSFERPVHSVNGEYRLRFNPSTIFEFNAGVTRMDTGLNSTFGVMADRRLGNFWVGGGFARSLSFTAGSPTAFANGLTAAGFYDTFSMRLRGDLTANTGIQLDARLSRDGAARLAESSKSLLGQARLDHRLTDRTVAFASFQTFQQNRNEYVMSSMSRNRFTIGLEFSLSSEAQRRTNQLNKDEQYVSVTDQIRRRQDPE